MLQTVSIHALREEGDPKPDHEWPGIHVISIHALREEGDPGHSAALPTAPRFLSTPSARRATLMALPSLSRMAYFYPRPPRGGRRQAVLRRMRPPDISIHALREEGNRALTGTSAVVSKFLSTPSARRATRLGEALRARNGFLSTPSARRATEALANYRQMNEEDFYPRPPRGGRLAEQAAKTAAEMISIHALREEGDS